MSEKSGVPKNLLEVFYVINKGVQRGLPSMWQSWIGSEETPLIIERVINLGPVEILEFIKEHETKGPSPTQIAFVKTRLLLKNYNIIESFDLQILLSKLMPSEATGLILEHVNNVNMEIFQKAFKELGVKCFGQWGMVENIINKPGPTYFTSELVAVQLIGSRNMTYGQQARYAKEHGGRIATLEEVLNFFLDLAIRGKMMNYCHPLYEVAEKFKPLALKEDEERGYLTFFVKTSDYSFDTQCSPDDRKKYYSVWITIKLNDFFRSSITISERPGKEGRENMGVMVSPL